MTIEQQIERFIVNEIMLSDRGKGLGHDEMLLDSGIIDSLALLRLIDFIEVTFNVEIEAEEIIPDHFQTINAAARLVESKR